VAWINITQVSKQGMEPNVPVNTDSVLYARNGLGVEAGEYSCTVLRFMDGSELGIGEPKEWFFQQAHLGG
jgi:hypothetical protein